MTDSNEKFFAEALSACFERMLAGDTLEDCLADYPEQADALIPLLQTMSAGRAAANISPDDTFRARARFMFNRALDEHWQQTLRPTVSWRMRLVTTFSAMCVLLLSGGGGVMVAASDSMPGQPLYSVKRGTETMQIHLAHSNAAKARLYAVLADRRAGEILHAARNGDAALTVSLTVEFTENLNMVYAIMADTIIPVNAYHLPPSPHLDDPRSQTAIEEAATSKSTSHGNSGDINNPRLLKLLQESSARNIAGLTMCLADTHPDTREALLAAIQAVGAGYEQLLGYNIDVDVLP
ncbi:MAG: DUF5667 domain-containing protein [Dehalococcoidia bacterium]|nr:DUF5667 domain-containing protein [Dehalococcoidia bacterium]